MCGDIISRGDGSVVMAGEFSEELNCLLSHAHTRLAKLLSRKNISLFFITTYPDWPVIMEFQQKLRDEHEWIVFNLVLSRCTLKDVQRILNDILDCIILPLTQRVITLHVFYFGSLNVTDLFTDASGRTRVTYQTLMETIGEYFPPEKYIIYNDKHLFKTQESRDLLIKTLVATHQ